MEEANGLSNVLIYTLVITELIYILLAVWIAQGTSRMILKRQTRCYEDRLHGYEGLDKNMFFRLKTGNKIRGHNWALAKDHFKLDVRKYAFSQRTVNEWNKLPRECVNAISVNKFLRTS